MGFGSKVLDRTLIIGVSGVIGSGKSTLCRYLQRKFDFHWINADLIVRELYKAGQPGYKKIKEYFGSQFVGPKAVYRGRLRQFVLRNSQKLWILNRLMHPLVFHEVNKKIVQIKRLTKGKSRPCICIEALYFEPSDLGKFIDRLFIVDYSDAVILKRLRSRRIPVKQLKTLLRFQRKHMLK